MTVQRISILDSIARAKAASKSGLLATYAPAKSANAVDNKTTTSWGPMMRSSMQRGAESGADKKGTMSWGPMMRK